MRTIAASAVLLAAWMGAARAQEDPARTAYAQALAAFNEGHFSTALEKFSEAYELRPSYKILYNIAQTHLELHDPAAAYDAFVRYLNDGGASIDAQRRAEVEQEMERLRQVVGELVVVGDVGARWELDGVPRGHLPLPDPVRLRSGTHQVRVSGAEGVLCTGTVTVAPGIRTVATCLADELPEESRLSTVTEPMTGRPAAHPPQPRPQRSRGPRIAAWAASGTAAALWIGAGIAGVSALSQNASLNRACTNGLCPASYSGDIDRLHRTARAADVLWIGAALFSVSSAILWAVSARSANQEAAVAWTPGGVSW